MKSELESHCNTYPKSSAQLQLNPPTAVAPSQPDPVARTTSSEDNPATSHSDPVARTTSSEDNPVTSQADTVAVARTTSSGNNQLGHPFLLIALPFFVIRIYV